MKTENQVLLEKIDKLIEEQKLTNSLLDILLNMKVDERLDRIVREATSED